MNKLPQLDLVRLDRLLDEAFREDFGDGDITSDTLFGSGEPAHAYIKVKADGAIAGVAAAQRVFNRLDSELDWKPAVKDGDIVRAGETLVDIQGERRALLGGERLALNILQHLSGIATLTAQYVAAVAGTGVEILDTRKTLPGLRFLQKYGVAAGGGTNHRMGLFDGIMIKDNHIRLYGGIHQAVMRMRGDNPRGLKIEVETSTLDEVDEALGAGADIIMLDNMDPSTMREAVHRIDGRARVEASGGVTLQRVAEIAATGVDCISVGELTHSVRALDIGLYFY